MKIGGIISAILGAALTVFGVVRNADQELVAKYYWEYGPTASPGKTFITFGIMLFALGIALFIAGYITKKKKQSE